MVKGEQEYSIYLMKKQYTFRTINIFKKSTYYSEDIQISGSPHKLYTIFEER